MSTSNGTEASENLLKPARKGCLRCWRAAIEAVMMVTVLAAVLLPGFYPGCRSAIAESATDPAMVFRDLKSRDLNVRQAAVESLVDLALSPEGDKAIRANLKMLAQIIGDGKENGEVRGQIVRAIAMVNERKRIDRDIVPGLIKVLQDEKENEDVRSWIAMSLPDFAPPEIAGPPLLAASRSKNPHVRVNAAQQVGRLRLDPDKVIPWLREGINDPEMAMRVAVVSTAGQFAKRDRRALEVFLRGLADHDEMVRGTAVGLVQHGLVLGTDAKGAREAVEKLLQDPVPRVAMSAAAALMKIAPKDATKYLPILIKGLQSDKPDVREAAAQALAMKGPEAGDAVPALKKALQDPSERMKVHSAMALARITGEKDPYVGVLLELGRSANPEVMMWAKGYEMILRAEADERRKKQKKEE